jgi:N-methylhydantoinase B
MAQIASIHRGAERLGALVSRYGSSLVKDTMQSLISYSERATRTLFASIPDGEYSFHDFLDDDGIHPDPVLIKVKITINGDEAIVDFTGSAPQQATGINAVYAITLSAVAYVFRCLLALDVPNNQGCMKPIRVIAPAGTIVNASPPAAVAGGNVETAQRIVDVLFGALSKACPEIVPAASQGTMNNLTIGGSFSHGSRLTTGQQGDPFTYYETIGGGSGATNRFDGASAIHSHMTNTLNTPIEALEYSFPFRVKKYAIRKKSGGTGHHKGGDGIIKEIIILTDCQGTLLAERRKIPPYGLAGGKPGACGIDYLIREGKKYKLPSKGTFDLHKGDILCIETPGGGGFGEE